MYLREIPLCAGNAAHAEQLRQRALSLVTFFGQTKKVTKKTLTLPKRRKDQSHQNKLTLYLMVLNLSKTFSFSDNAKAYAVDYFVTRNAVDNEPATAGNIWLVLDVSVNERHNTKYKLVKPTSFLYQSNDMIEKIVQDDTLALLTPPSAN